MTCGSAREALLDLARGVAMPESERLAVETHVSTCPACAADLERHRDLTAALQALSAEAQAWSASPEIEQRLQAAFEAERTASVPPSESAPQTEPLGLRTGHGRHRRARGLDRQPRAAPAGQPRDGVSALPGGGTGRQTAARVATGSRGSTFGGTAGGQHFAAIAVESRAGPPGPIVRVRRASERRGTTRLRERQRCPDPGASGGAIWIRRRDRAEHAEGNRGGGRAGRAGWPASGHPPGDRRRAIDT